MNILHTVESYLPARHGMAEVVRQLSEGLAKRGHKVTVATSIDLERNSDYLSGVEIRSFPISGNMVSGIKGSKEDYVRFVREGQFDLIACFAAQQWATDLLLPHLSDLKAKKVFVPTGFSALQDPDYYEYFKRMPGWLRAFDRSVFLSDTYQDALFAQQYDIQNTVVIPNGASAKEFNAISGVSSLREKLRIGDRAKLILHVGNYTGEKGHSEAIQIFLNARITNATLLFVGQRPEKILQILGRRKRYLELPKQYLLARKKIMARALNRENTVQAFKEADVFLFPSRIECSPIVLFEAAAAGTPFLATEVGNSREIADWTGGGFIIPTTQKGQRGAANIKAGSRQLEELLNDDKLRESMGASARKAWKERFTWEKITLQYEELYQTLTTAPDQ